MASPGSSPLPAPMSMPATATASTSSDSGSADNGAVAASEIAMWGDYGELTNGASETVAAAAPHVLQACTDAVCPSPTKSEDSPSRTHSESFTIADFGTADGRNSLRLLCECVDAVRDQDGEEDRPVVVLFEDQPVNDFSHVQSLFQESGRDNVFPLISARTFFRACVPPETLNVGFSFTSMHYLSSTPALLERALVPHVLLDANNQPLEGAGPDNASEDANGRHADALAAFQQQAAADWEDILLARAQELAPGGRFVIANLMRDETTGHHFGNTGRGQNIYAVFSEILQEMCDEGLVTADELLHATSPEYYRTMAEHRAPFEDTESKVARAGLRLEHSVVIVCECPYLKQWLSGDYGNTATEYGAYFAERCKPWSFFKIMRAFQGDHSSRSETDANKLVESFYQRFGQRVAQQPTAFAMDYVSALLVISK